MLAGLTLFGVVWLQFFGVARGYHCECADAPSAFATCEEGGCHAAEEKPDCDGERSKDSGQRTDSGDSCLHGEVRESLSSTAAGGPVSLPVPVFVESPRPFDAMAAREPDAWENEPSVPPEEEWGGPPMPLLVARSVVLMV